MVAWSIPRLWPASTVAILASGESMSFDVAQAVRPFKVIAINTTAKLAPWADIVYAADAEFWQTERWANDLPGLKVGMRPHPGVHLLEVSSGPGPDRHAGFDPDPSRLRTGGNSGYQALQVAVHAGARRVLLCGFDMRGGHWHGPHPAPLRETHPDNFALWIKRFDGLAPILDEMGVEVINCTPDSALKCFRFAPLEQALAESLERATA